MDGPPMERKLVAILSADGEGYSRLMGEDEAATVRTITEYREGDRGGGGRSRRARGRRARRRCPGGVRERRGRRERRRRHPARAPVAERHAAGGWIGWRWLGASKTTGLPLPDKPSVAVLPFTNLSQDPAQEYFGDGVTEDLITGLSKVSGMFVIARNSAFTYKGKPVKVRDGRSAISERDFPTGGRVTWIGFSPRCTGPGCSRAHGRHSLTV